MAPEISSTPPLPRAEVADAKEDQSSVQHHEHISTVPSLPPGSSGGWKFSSKNKADGDTALALFTDLDDLHGIVDPETEKTLVRKIDFMILPYLGTS